MVSRAAKILGTVVWLSVSPGAVPCGAATLHVPGNYLTIQEAIDSAATGDTILVAPDTYVGTGNRDIHFLGKALLLQAEMGPSTTILDVQGSTTDYHRGFWFRDDESRDSILDGFTIQNGFAEGGGILCSGSSSPTIRNCTLKTNSSTGGNGEIPGGGFACMDAAAPLIQDCSIMQNNGGGYAGGVAAVHSSSPEFERCIIDANDGAGVLCLDGSTVCE